MSRRRYAYREAGYVTLLSALFVGFCMIPLCAISIDVSRWYVEVARVQNAADAASLAGVTFLPADFASARATALHVAAENGYADAGATHVEVAVGTRPTQLVVTITSTVQNAFGAAIGVGHQHISRSATADYAGSAPLGSPCNTLGNEPPGTTGAGPAGSVAMAPPGGAVCSTNPQLWAAIGGPDLAKVNGDEFSTRHCTGSEDGCTGSTNREFNPSGYFYDVKVPRSAVNAPLTLQIYDPAFIETGQLCEGAPTSISSAPVRDAMNPFTVSDGTTRYEQTPGPFCTGDVLESGTTPLTTSFVLRQPTDTTNPLEGAPMASCEHQYAGFAQKDVTSLALMQYLPRSSGATRPGTTPNPEYNPFIARDFHQWVPLCTFTPTAPGDYYLQVRTDVALGGSPDGAGGFTGNSQVWQQSGDDPSVGGDGLNAFSLRVFGPADAGVSISGWQHMEIYANYTGAQSTFNLVRVNPAAATKTLLVDFFDVGDAASPGTIAVLPPTDSNLTSLTGCVGSGVVTGALTGCRLTGVSSNTGWNGKHESVRIPIPSTYTCNATAAGGCWFRLQVSFPSSVHDLTTWSAEIEGDPVRLIK